MVYKRYIVRDGKKIGPYYYKSVRTSDGRVKSVYIGRAPEKNTHKPGFFSKIFGKKDLPQLDKVYRKRKNSKKK
jgi:hypothetical protein